MMESIQFDYTGWLQGLGFWDRGKYQDERGIPLMDTPEGFNGKLSKE